MSQSIDNSLFGTVLVQMNKVDRKSAGSIEIEQLNKAAAILTAYGKEELINQSLDLRYTSCGQYYLKLVY